MFLVALAISRGDHSRRPVGVDPFENQLHPDAHKARQEAG